MEKESKKESKKVMQAGRSAAEAGASRGGGGFASQLCKEIYTSIQHALLPLNEVRRIYRLPPLPPTSYESQLV